MADTLFTIGAIMMWASPSIPFLMVARFVIGLGVGAASMIIPVYLAEISPTEIRGSVVACNNMVITAGQFISSIISLCLGNRWRLMLGLAGVPAALQFICMLFMPESQRWLAKKQKNDKCLSVIKTIYKPAEIEREF